MMNHEIIRLFENSFMMSACISLLYILSRLMCGKTSPQLRRACWMLIAVELLIPARPVLYNISPSDVLPVPVSDTILRISAQPARLQLDVALAGNIPVATTLWSTGGIVQLPEAGEADTPTTVKSAPRAWASLYSWAADKWLAIIWAVGAFAFLSSVAIRQRRFTLNIRQFSRPAADADLIFLLANICHDIKLRRQPRLLVSPALPSPVATGFLRSAIILPDETIEQERLYLMLLHEVMHIKRGDVWVKALSLTALAVNWFNPFAYLMNCAIVTESEMACDAAVLRLTGVEQRFAYGEAILHTARRVRGAMLLTAMFSSGGRNLRRRLAAIAERKNTKRWAAALLSGVLLAGGLFGCGGSSSGSASIQDAKVDLTPTDQLVLYFPVNTKFSERYGMAVLKFRGMYPDVNVTVKRIGDKDNDPTGQYQASLNTDLMAGSGPDVIFTNYFMSDLYKVMDTGTFLNLNTVIAGDSDFNMNDYNAVVMTAGYYKGGQYIIPITYTAPILLADQNGLDSAGFDLAKAVNATSFLNEVDQCLPKLQENPAFGRIIDDTVGTALLHASGIQLINAETKEVLPDEADFRAFCEAYQPFWANDTSGVAASMRFYEAMSSGAMLFQTDFIISDFLSWGIIKDTGGTPVWTALRTQDGGLTAAMDAGAAVNANSKNQLNAWNYIKILLSKPIQLVEPGYDLGLRAFPVNKTALSIQIANDISGMYDPAWGFNGMIIDAGGKWGYNLRPIPAKDKAPYTALHADITSCSFKNAKLYSFFDTCMTPYFKGDKSLDDCIADLKNQLTLYALE